MDARLLAPTALSLLSLACGDPEADPPPTDPMRACMQALPRLTVSGSRLLFRCEGRDVPVRLKGLNRSGLQHKDSLQAAGFGPDPAVELRRWRDLWRAEVVRIPLGQSYYSKDAYQADVALVVAAARSLSLYVILELHGYDAGNLNGAQPDPDTTPGFWAQVARTYGGQTHVLFDLWNEPHDVPWATWKGNAEKITRAVRAAGAKETLIVIGGLDYAYDLTPLLEPQGRLEGLGPIVYATHPYPRKSDPPAMAPEWDLRFGRAAQIVPVIVGEYGVDGSGTPPFGLGDEAEARAWLAQLHAYIDRLQLTALAWSAGDAPQLTLGVTFGDVALPDNPPNPARPTSPFGLDVKAWMTR